MAVAEQGAAGTGDETSQGVSGVPAQPTGNVQQAPDKQAEQGKEGRDEVHGTSEPEKKQGDPGASSEPEKGKEPDTAAEPPEPEKGSEAWHKQFVQTGNEHADAAIEIMKEAGVSPIEANEVFKQALENGKLEDIKWDILIDKIGKGKTALVKAGVEAFFEGEYKSRMETVNKAHEIMGGKENWEKVAAWAQKTEKTDAKFKTKIDNLRQAIDLGGWAAAQAVTELKTMYEGVKEHNGLGTGKITSGNKSGAGSDQGGLSRAEYMKERHKLADAGVPDNDPRVRRLFARRELGQQQGI